MRLALTGDINATVFDNLLHSCSPCILGQDQRLELDLSSAGWALPSGLVALTGLLKFLQQKGVETVISEYPDQSVCRYYCRVDFFRQIGARSPCEGMHRRPADFRFIEMTELQEPQIGTDARKRLSGLLQRLPAGIKATDVSRNSFIDSCGELISNTRHAYDERIDADVARRPRALVQAQFYPARGIVELCICDAGIGIKRSMEGVQEGGFNTHSDAIDAALVFRNKNPLGDGVGLGLSAIESYVRKNGGTLRIRSGDALKLRRGSTVTKTSQLPCWDGTIVSMEILVEKKTDLSVISNRLARTA